MTNPLLTEFSLPPFSSIHPRDIVPAINTLLEACRQSVENIVAQSSPFTWETLCQPLAESDNRLTRIWSAVSHLNAVKNSPELRAAYEQCLPLLSEYSTWIGQHAGLYQAYLSLKNSVGFAELDAAERKSVENALRDFRLSGIALTHEKQKRYGVIAARLSELEFTYSNNVLDSTMGWSKLIADVAELKGMPDSALNAAQERAKNRQLTGWLLTLDMPSYLAVITWADDAALRQEIWRAFATLASDESPHAAKFDNSDIMEEILALRHELAQLLDFSNYAWHSLATKMAEHPQQVLDFLHDLARRARPQAEQDLTELRAFARRYYQADELNVWDIPYYAEKQKQHLFSINDEQLRPYFPEQRVLDGLFDITRRIYGVVIRERQNVESWHEEVRFYDLFDDNGELRASFYLDLYTRENKRAGAWMGDCIQSLRINGRLQKPVAYLVCNFNRPEGDKPALFTHKEVVTLFHEFGHGLHHMLTRIEAPGVSGISGVPWDTVELPSQFMENWCWKPEALALISGHYQSQESLPQHLLDKLLEAKNYQAALFILRQLELGLFDFHLHCAYNPEQGAQILPVLQQIKKQVAVITTPSWARSPHSFSHIFAGGYAAGYYSYLWAEVLAADAFSRFEEEGIFNPDTGRNFLENILSRGGSEEPMVLFKRFRGREPSPDAMLRHYGITG